MGRLERITGHHIEVIVNPEFIRKNEITRLVGSNQNLRGLVGDIPHLPFEQTLRDMLDTARAVSQTTS